MPCSTSQILRLLVALAAGLWTAGCATAPFGDELGISPFEKWQQIETEHFWISFSESTSAVSERVATYLEDAHRTLAPTLLWEPPKKTQVILIDSFDSANGSASPQRTPGMVLRLVAPNPESPLNWSDSWLRSLCLHEYTHFLSMDPTRGIYTPARWIWGDALLPNASWYPWMLEGYAVFFETRYHGGRGRGSFWNMILRSMVLQGTLDTDSGVTLDRMMVANPYFPAGETWYLFGYSLTHAFWKQAQLKEVGDWGLGILSKNSSSRVPYLIDGAAYEVIGMGWTALWSDWVAHARTQAQSELALIRRTPVTPLQWHTAPAHAESREVAAPVESPSGGQLAYIASSTRDWEALWLYDLRAAGAPPRRLVDTLEVTQLSWSPDSHWLAYASLARTHQYSLFYDLYAVRPGDGHVVRLTEGERARDPDFSPDGKWLTYLRTPRTGFQELVRAEVIREGEELHLGARTVLVAGKILDRLASARFGATSDSIFFSQHTDGQYSEEIWEWTPLATRPVLGGNSDRAFQRYPFFARAGVFAGHLLYQSDQTGVDQIYARGPRVTGRISNFETGARMVSPASALPALWVAGFSAHGWELAQFEPLASPLATPPVDALPVAQADAPPPAQLQLASVPQSDSPPSEREDYSGANSLYPRMWGPLALYGPGYFALSASAFGNDALDFHRYAVTLGMESLSLRPYWVTSYTNRSLGPSLTIALSEQTTGILKGDDGTLLLRRLEAGFGASFPFRTTFSSLTPEFAIAAAQDYAYQTGSNPWGTFASRGSYIPRIDFGATYRYTRESILSVAPETGRISELWGRLALTNGSPVPKVFASHTEYIRVSDTHVVIQPRLDTLWTPLSAALAGGERPRVSGFPFNYTGATSLTRLGAVVANENLYQLSLRGYPGLLIASSWASTASLDARFPIWNIYRGINTLPITFERLIGRVFLESAIFPFGDFAPAFLPSAGAALEFELTFFTQLHLALSLQFQNGFIPGAGGDQVVVFGLNSAGF